MDDGSIARARHYRGLLVVLSIQAVLLLYCAGRQSVTNDEYGHFAAGLAYCRQGDLRLFNVNPPLVRCLATILVSRQSWPELSDDWSPPARPEFFYGRHLASTRADQLRDGIAVGRIVVSGFAILGTVLCWAWARHLAGDLAGIVAAAFWAFQPQVIAHGSLITNDIPVAVCMLWTTWAFSCWCRKRSFRRAFYVGVTLAIATLCKFTALVLWPIFACFAVAACFRSPVRVVASHAVIATIITLFVIALPYRFEGVGTRLGDLDYLSSQFRDLSGEPSSSRFAPFNEFLQDVRSPFPEQFLLGLDRQQVDFEFGLPSYAFGQTSGHGWWWFYLYSMLVKMPSGTLLAVVASIFFLGSRTGIFNRDIFLLVSVVLVLIEVTALKSGFAQQHRYIFPVYPFLFVLVATALADDGCRRLAGRCVMVGLGLTVLGMLWAAPDWLGAFNLISGGTRYSHRHLFNDATDWGQDTDRVVRWIKEHPDRRPLHLHSKNGFHEIDPSALGLPDRLGEPIPGSAITWYVISKSDFVISPERFKRFLAREPDDRIGATHLVFAEPREVTVTGPSSEVPPEKKTR